MKKKTSLIENESEACLGLLEEPPHPHHYQHLGNNRPPHRADPPHSSHHSGLRPLLHPHRHLPHHFNVPHHQDDRHC